MANRPNLRSNFFLSATTPGYIDRKDLERRGVTDGKQFTGFNKGDIILSPVEARAVLITHSGQQEFGGTEAYTTVRLLFRDQDRNNCGVTMSVLAGELLVDGIPPAPTDHHPVSEDGKKIDFNQPLFRLTTENQTPRGMGRFYPGQNGQVVLGASCDLGNIRGMSLTPTFIPATGTNGIAISTSA